MNRYSPKVALGRRWIIVTYLGIGVLLVGFAGSNSVNAQPNSRVASAERSFRTTIAGQMSEAAQRAHVALLPGAMAYVGGDDGLVINAAIQDTDRLDPRSLGDGKDLLFVYIGARGFAVPEGYYKVRLKGDQAQFIAADGKLSATLPANVAQIGTAELRIKNVQVSIGWGKDGFEFDIVITFGKLRGSHVTIPIPPK